MNIRHAVRAGTFYESSQSSCAHHAIKLIESAAVPEDLPATLYGGIVPHAGWMYSGRLAALTLKALHHSAELETVVIFGADHTGLAGVGEVFDSGVWRTPLGEVPVDDGLAKALLEAGDLLRPNPRAHQNEHSIEVQLPLLQVLQPNVRVVPITVPPTVQAVQIGQLVGAALARHMPAARVVGSSDLTHHGGHFPAPGGRGEKGEHWSRQNDRRLIDIMEAMDAPAVVPEVDQHGNACGAGAIAATIAACRVLGASRGILLEYTNSYEIIRQLYPGEQDDTTVGYASVVFA